MKGADALFVLTLARPYSDLQSRLGGEWADIHSAWEISLNFGDVPVVSMFPCYLCSFGMRSFRHNYPYIRVLMPFTAVALAASGADLAPQIDHLMQARLWMPGSSMEVRW